MAHLFFTLASDCFNLEPLPFLSLINSFRIFISLIDANLPTLTFYFFFSSQCFLSFTSMNRANVLHKLYPRKKKARERENASTR